MPNTPSSTSSSSQKKPEAEKKSTGTYYAWSNFPVQYDEHGRVTESIEVGDPVSQSDLDVSDEEWDELVENGAVSEDEYPDIPAHVSPAEYQAQVDIHGAMQDAMATQELKMTSSPEPFMQPETDDADEKPATETKATPSSSSSSSSKS